MCVVCTVHCISHLSCILFYSILVKASTMVISIVNLTINMIVCIWWVVQVQVWDGVWDGVGYIPV